MKAPIDRIPYYLRKMRQFTSIPLTERRNPYRYQRLMAYKKRMHEHIKDEHPQIYRRVNNE